MGFDKYKAMSSLTQMERIAAELWTKIAVTDNPDIFSFNEFERIIVSTALRFGASNAVLKLHIIECNELMKESDKWWKQ